MLRKSLILAIIVLSLVLISHNALSEVEESDSDNDSTNLLILLGVVYLVLAIGIFGYKWERDIGMKKRFHPLHFEHEYGHESKERNYSRMYHQEEEIKHPVVYVCPNCNKQFVSTAPRERVKCPWCKIKKQMR